MNTDSPGHSMSGEMMPYISVSGTFHGEMQDSYSKGQRRQYLAATSLGVNGNILIPIVPSP